MPGLQVCIEPPHERVVQHLLDTAIRHRYDEASDRVRDAQRELGELGERVDRVWDLVPAVKGRAF